MLDDYALVNDGTPLDLCGQEHEEENVEDTSYADDDAVYSTAHDNYVANNKNDDDATDDGYTYNVEEAYFKVDDAYFNTYQVINDAEECPQDGVYAFETEFKIPGLGRMWRATGWKANGIVMLAAGGNVLGSCSLAFETKAFGMSSKKFFTIFGSVVSVALFFGIFVALRRGVGFKASDDAKDFYEIGDDVIRAAADAAASRCAHPSELKEKDKDLECTFESDSTPSYLEKQEDSIDTSFGTHNHVRMTPGIRPAPIRVRELMNARFHPPLAPTISECLDHAFHFQEGPPSPIKKHNEDVDSTPLDSSAFYFTPPRKDDRHYTPPRNIV
jgi:hypothetical protein